MIAAAFGSGSPAMAAPTPLGSVATSGCPAQVPIWKIHYQLFMSSSSGATLPAAQASGALAGADAFVQLVGQLSECAVGIQMDVVLADTPWAGGDDVYAVPMPAGYDAGFARVPAGPSSPAGRATGSSTIHRAMFPVRPTGSGADPNPHLMVHEWLHQVVAFYTPPNGWPSSTDSDAVHAGCNVHSSYQARDPGFGCMILPSYMSDLMLGRVIEGGVAKGLGAAEWARQGTPRQRAGGSPSPGPDPGSNPRADCTPSTPAPNGRGAVRLSVSQLRINQRISQGALWRAKRLTARLDGRPAPPRPRQRAGRITVSRGQLAINHRISLEARHQVAVLCARITGGGLPSLSRRVPVRSVRVNVTQLSRTQWIAQAALRDLSRLESLASRSDA
ncbi:hypothetical protein [Miltoncostaea oceani]|uniref:hypothetical protein n=1 Tax=Miltoncostaea oceani TaxID=2843216 RepID=UPI001C3CAB3D|nr:hypothetical protein [Miltoncostaea oceani]